ncbi:MAG: isocitrate lyase/phosphoenolpyruvate mutase family protein, partial [Aestuariivirgaceae bacterium]
LTARCEVFYTPHSRPYAEAVKRCNLYADAGADCVFVPGLAGRDVIRSFVRDANAPVNIVTETAETRLSVAELAELGVKRISTGGSLARACFGLLERSASEIAETGQFEYLDHAITDPEIDSFFRNGGPAKPR